MTHKRLNPLKTIVTLACAALLPASAALAAQEPVWDANKVIMTSEKLGDGVFAYYSDQAKAKESQGLPVATSGGFIVGKKGVLIIDTMLNKRLNQQVQDLVAQATNKPILYAVNTSFHGDHSYGNMYLPKETTIIQHAVARAYVTSHFVSDTQFMIKNFGQGRGIDQIKPTPADILIPKGGKLTIELGGKSVELIDFGFAQTGGDLFVWEPTSKVLWTGNPVITVKPALPWLLDGHLVQTLASLRSVYQFLPDDARVVPGHGSVIEKEDLKWHIDYLATVKKEVQAAIDQGLTLEQTVKQVTMHSFGGYALFGWVHPGMNVPAAYKDLKAKSR